MINQVLILTASTVSSLSLIKHRFCAGQIEHKHIAERLIEAGLEAFGGDEPNFLRLSQSFKLAERLLKSTWAERLAERQKAA